VAAVDGNESLWMATAPRTDFPTLEGSAEADVVVVGGGIAGLATAWFLQRAGRDVLLVEAERIATGASAYATVKVTAGHRLKYSELSRRHPRAAVTGYARANTTGLEEIARLVDDLGIDCDFERRSHIVWAESDEELETLKVELEAERQAGLGSSLTAEIDLPFEVAGGLVLEGQAQFHPRRFLLGLADAFVAEGGTIIENTRAKAIDEDDRCRIETDQGPVTADDVVVATHYPITNRGGLFAKLSPQMEYCVAGWIDPAAAPSQMYINAGSSTRSVRTAAHDGGLLLIVAGEQHKVGEERETETHYEALETWTRERFGVTSFAFRWSTQDNYAVDGLPYVGPVDRRTDHLFVVTGFGAWGMTNGVAAGMVIRDLIEGRRGEWADVFSPQRTDVARRPGIFLKENMKVAAHWVGDRLSIDEQGPSDLEPGEAAIVDRDGERVAALRDDTGTLRAVSAICTHLGCVVEWNAAERSWDCPCHGSRFGVDGDVIQAPAVEPLERREI
jgi:glycine/D-amino acid oxidase-like deaminating enzyme/nitrite reductase/ring-hydroxylating ferredoxin subunit